MATPFNPFATPTDGIAAFNPFGLAPMQQAPAPLAPMAATGANPFLSFPEVKTAPAAEVAPRAATKRITLKVEAEDGRLHEEPVDTALDSEAEEDDDDTMAAATKADSNGMHDRPAAASPTAKLTLGCSKPFVHHALERTPSLSNRSQLELMAMLRDGKLTSAQALPWAEHKEAEERTWRLSNASQLKILTLVRDGKLSKEDALAEAQQREQQELAEQEEEVRSRNVAEFYAILNQLSELDLADPRADRVSSFDRDMVEAKRLLASDPPVDE